MGTDMYKPRVVDYHYSVHQMNDGSCLTIIHWDEGLRAHPRVGFMGYETADIFPTESEAHEWGKSMVEDYNGGT